MATWTLKPGEITRRGEIAQRYGGGQQRGIEPSRTTPNIMLYSDPDAGAEHDYDFDGWDAKDGVYHYTGGGAGRGPADHQWEQGDRRFR